MRKKLPPLLIAALCALVTAAFFRFALIGYGVMSLCFCGLAAVLILFWAIGRLRRPKKWRIALLCLLLAGAILFTVGLVPVLRDARTDADAKADYLIVLGAGVNGTRPSLSLVNRLTAAKAYLEEHPAALAIVTGGQGPGEHITEAEAMFLWLTEAGIAPERILREEKATSTEENLRFSLEIIASRGGDPAGKIAIVSSEYHLHRAKQLAAALGAEPVGVAGRTTYPVLRANYFIRETLAVWYGWVFGY